MPRRTGTGRGTHMHRGAFSGVTLATIPSGTTVSDAGFLTSGGVTVGSTFTTLPSGATVSSAGVDTAGGVTSVSPVSVNNKIMLTPSGGVAVKLTNGTGAASVKGYVVHSSVTTANAVALSSLGVPDPIGVFYESGTADGSEAWVVVSGIADVYFIGGTTRGYLARGFLAADSGFVAGQAMCEAVPTSPFSDDKHFYEIGHVLETRTGPGLAKCVLHFN